MGKVAWVLLGVIAVAIMGTVAEADKMGISLVLDPNITSYPTNNYNYYNYNVSGGKNTSSSDPYLTNDSLTIYFNEAYLNGTIDDRMSGGAETDPLWTANYTACSSSQKLYFSGDSLACNSDDDDPEAGEVSWSDLLDDGTFTNNKYCTYDSSGPRINCNSDAAAAEVDPYWTANQTDYYNKSDVDTLDIATNTSMKAYVDSQDSAQDECSEITNCVPNSWDECSDATGCGYLTSESDPFWTANQSDYYTSAQVDSLDSATNTTLKSYCDATFLTSESDPFWTGNVTACASGNHLYFSSGSLACEPDDDDPETIDCAIITGNASDLCSITPGVGGGDSKWVDGGAFLYPNSTFASNVIVYGYIHATDWTNVTITEAQISDLDHTVCTDLDGDYLSCDVDLDVDAAGICDSCGFVDTNTDTNASTACSGTTTYLDGEGNCDDISGVYYDSCEDISCGFLDAEVDPFWTANQSNYYTSSEVDSLDSGTNTSVVNWVTSQGYLTSYSETDPLWSANYTAYNTTWSDDSPDDDSEVPDDITVTSSHMINTTQEIYATKICLDTGCAIFVNGTGMYQTNGGETWWFHVNASGDLRIETI